MTDPDQVPMWEYWRDKKGIQLALEDQYPELLVEHPMLVFCLNQIKSMESAIDDLMRELNV